ncbi:MAG: carboxypeptidase-like regulatory domain-containing protein [Alistipes sp.]|nr:carboxypeptidase-like regulatory domain-containing protein [Alistipes sp.]
MRMKLTIGRKLRLVLPALCFLCTWPAAVDARASSQDNPVTLKKENTTIRAILDEIERTTPYKFFYNEDIVDADKQVRSFDVVDKPLHQVLDMLFEDTRIAYKVVEYQVVLSARAVAQPASQTVTVTGRVIDQDGQPIIGVSVIEKGTTNGTATGMDGYYSIRVGRNAVLEFTYLGYTP